MKQDNTINKLKTSRFIDILHLYQSGVLSRLTDDVKRLYCGISTFEKIQKTALSFFKVLKNTIAFRLNRKNYNRVLSNQNWLYVLGVNNHRSLSFLEEKLPNIVYVSPYKYKSNRANIYQIHLPNHLKHYIKGLPFIYRLLKRNRTIQPIWDVVFKANGQYEASLDLLTKYQPKSITFSNDHALEARALIIAAKSLNIPTFYIQHACVSEEFPPLRFSIAFLEGQDAEDKYKKIAYTDTKIKLVGIPRMAQQISQKNTAKKVKRIGICSNLLDSTTSIKEVIDLIVKQFPNLIITYRPHPTDNRDIYLPETVRKSNSRKESPFDFLQKQDLIIAGNTSIHYEAAVLNIIPVYYNFDKNEKLNDVYSFIKNGLVENAVNTETLLRVISDNIIQKQNILERAKYYHATLCTQEEDKSDELVINEILSYLDLTNK